MYTVHANMNTNNPRPCETGYSTSNDIICTTIFVSLTHPMVKWMRFLVNKTQIVGVKGSLGGLPDAIVGYQGVSIGVRSVGRTGYSCI